MPNWNTEKIMKDLSDLMPNAKDIQNLGQGGDYDTDNIFIKFHGTKDGLYLCGFNPETLCTTPENAEVDYVEVTDGKDSQGGLNSDNNDVAQAFLEVKKYLRSKKFIVVNTIQDFV
jgi:hypothetical protein